ncbi:hypothetical protein ABZ442_27010 [Streptomyces triculaminicus]|uniref:hypothetical protein n=1 Tax=Streptomyces triculaminicus TaxID=2816232 RepID=UPI0033EC8453
MSDALDFTDKARRARLRLIGIGVTAGVVLTGGAVLAVTTLGGGDHEKGSMASPGASSAAPAPSTSSGKRRTPASEYKLRILKSDKVKDAIGVGFPQSDRGAVSAAVRHLQELDLLDDNVAEKQLKAIVSKDSPGTVDKRVSDVRKLRERAGLPPSGGTPPGLSFSTQVNAVRVTSADDTGQVLIIWMNYDRFASLPDKAADNNPLKGETDYAIYKWEDGDWKLTEEPRYTKRVHGPRAYDPDSPYAFQDMWRQVTLD